VAYALKVLDSGTSIGANVEEAVGGSSRKDFINKLQIAYKEARGNKIWLRLLREGE
jgi:four helix bundle protein